MDPKNKEYFLQDGLYQIPIYYEFPENMKTLSFDDFSKLQKIPCSSLLVRVQKAMKDEKGKPITIDKLDLTDAADKGYLITPPKYSEGKYNTMYVSVTSAENTIFEAKVRRFNPMLRVLLENVYAPNNKGNSTPTDNELVEYWKTKVLGKQPLKLADLGKYEYFDLRFFSEYIPNLGFSASLEFILNTPQKSFFYALMSLYPPGIMYKKDRDDNVPSTDSTVKAVFRMNYNTPQKAITYYDKEQQFYMTRPQSSSMIVIEVIEVKLKGKEIQKTETLGYSFMPIFQYVDVDGDSSSIELFVNSSIIQLPLIEGEPDATLLDKCYENGLTAAK